MFQRFKPKRVEEVDKLESDSKDGIDIYLCKTLSDKGKFAYAALCASFLRDIYYTDFEHFCHETLNIILNHLALSNQARNTIYDHLTGGDLYSSAGTWSAVLASEPNLKGRMKLIIEDLIGLALINGEYDARWRILILEVAKQLTGTSDFVEQSESLVAEFIVRGAKEPSESEKQIIRWRKIFEKSKRYAIISGVAVGCGALVGLTGGLAAPAIVEGIGVIASASAFGTAAVTALSSTMGTAAIASLFGTAGASLAGYKMKKRMGDIQEFAFGHLCQNGGETKSQIPLVENPHLSAVVAISGWVKDLDENNFSSTWGRLFISQEQYYLRYDTSALYELGQAMESSVTSSVLKTLLPLNYPGLMQAAFRCVKPVLPAILLGLASIIDLPWSVCCSKAVLVGKQLAEVLLAKEYGRRPISLIGFSIGARVIYYCLEEMSRREGSEGIIENVYLIGAPCPADPVSWNHFRLVVSGTITNGFSDSDTLLKFLYRTLSLPSGGVAGLKPIQVNHSRIKNVDLSKIVSGHSEIPLKINMILNEMNVRLINDDRLLQPSCSRS